jgi:RHS repeat-associated protein
VHRADQRLLPTSRDDGNHRQNPICYKYDGLDRLIHEVHKQGSTDCTTETANDAVTVYTYDPVGNRLTWQQPHPAPNITTYNYDQDNRLTTETNPATDVTATAYDGAGNIVSVTAPTTNVTNYTYDADDRVTQVTDGGGIVAKYGYDPEGRCVSRTDGNLNTTSPTCDAIYRVVAITDPLGKITTYVYDPFGNLKSTTDRNGNDTGMDHTTSDTYDAVNRRITMTDALGNATGTDHTTQYHYDKVGNLTTIIDANLNATSYNYDAVNRLIKETYADGTSRSFTYDFVGNPTSRTDQNGVTTSYTHSDLYFLLQRTYPVSSPDIMTYDLSGRMVTATRGGWLVTFSYDGASRVTQTVQNGRTVGYTYNIPARTENIRYPGGRIITESMDLRSRLSRVDDPSSPTPIVQYSYDPGNRVVQRTYRNGTSAAFTYNKNDWITQLQHSSGVNPIAGFTYVYDNEGNKQYEQKLQDPGHSELYLPYDPIYRLTNFEVGMLDFSTTPPTIPVPTTQTQYTYDPVGNWPKKVTNGIPETRTHNSVNEITTTTIDSNPPCSLSYDNNGNLTKDCVYTYIYDEENRLMTVTRISDSMMVGQYQYDALSRRVQKIANPSGTPTTTRYFYDDARIIEEQDGGAIIQATYVYGDYVDEVLTMDRGGQTYYYHQNALWSVEAITDSTATVVERDAYDAYGAPTTLTSAIGNPYLFTGRQLDAETGDYFYRARYYDPAKGRFLQRDQQEFRDVTNLYRYVDDNPTRFADPGGAFPIDFRHGVADAALWLFPNTVATAVGKLGAIPFMERQNSTNLLAFLLRFASSARQIEDQLQTELLKTNDPDVAGRIERLIHRFRQEALSQRMQPLICKIQDPKLPRKERDEAEQAIWDILWDDYLKGYERLQILQQLVDIQARESQKEGPVRGRFTPTYKSAAYLTDNWVAFCRPLRNASGDFLTNVASWLNFSIWKKSYNDGIRVGDIVLGAEEEWKEIKVDRTFIFSWLPGCLPAPLIPPAP